VRLRRLAGALQIDIEDDGAATAALATGLADRVEALEGASR
jgi:hypothetical protein